MPRFSFLVFLVVTATCQKLVVREQHDDALKLDPDFVEHVGPSVGESARHKNPTSPMTKLLDWGIEHSDMNELHERAEAIRQGRAKPQPFDAELMEALFPNPLEAMKKLTNVIGNTSSGVEEVANALYVLEDFIQDIDNANDLYKIDGIRIVSDRLNDPDNKIATNAAWVIGTLVQSNEKTQTQVLATNALQVLLRMLQSEHRDISAKAKALYAISATIRSNPEGIRHFKDFKGPIALIDVITNSHLPLLLRRKATTLIGDICIDESSIGIEFASHGVCKPIVELLFDDDVDVQSHCLETLNNLILSSSQAKQQCQLSLTATQLENFNAHATTEAIKNPDRYEQVLERFATLKQSLLHQS